MGGGTHLEGSGPWSRVLPAVRDERGPLPGQGAGACGLQSLGQIHIQICLLVGAI
jgi:hypothetical protein